MTPTYHTGIDQLGMSLLRVEGGKWKLEDYAEYK